MTPRERILAVYQGKCPDVVPYMLDLSHWFYQRHQMPWDLSVSYEEPEYALIDYHKKSGVGFYLPNLAGFFSATYPDDVIGSTTRDDTGPTQKITWRLETPVGTIERVRYWEDKTYAWGIDDWTFADQEGLRVLQYAMSSRRFEPHWDRYKKWADHVGDDGLVYLSPGYSAMGLLLNQWMGIENTMYAAMDFPEALQEAVDAINNNLLELIDVLCTSPAQVILMGDNLDGQVQPPSFFNRWSAPFYSEAIRRLHAAGKFVAVHIDGQLQGAIGMVRETGADCADAVTPTPMGDLSPAQCREEAGGDFILSGGVSPDLWLPNVPVDVFKAKVMQWLEQKHTTFRFIANAGDQVPPGAEESRIEIMRDLVEEHGRY